MLIVGIDEVTTMTNKHAPVEPENVACNICLTEIPESVAVSSEADEYAQHFCGIECYDIWRDKKEIAPKTNDTKTKK